MWPLLVSLLSLLLTGRRVSAFYKIFLISKRSPTGSCIILTSLLLPVFNTLVFWRRCVFTVSHCKVSLHWKHFSSLKYAFCRFQIFCWLESYRVIEPFLPLVLNCCSIVCTTSSSFAFAKHLFLLGLGLLHVRWISLSPHDPDCWGETKCILVQQHVRYFTPHLTWWWLVYPSHQKSELLFVNSSSVVIDSVSLSYSSLSTRFSFWMVEYLLTWVKN